MALVLVRSAPEYLEPGRRGVSIETIDATLGELRTAFHEEAEVSRTGEIGPCPWVDTAAVDSKLSPRCTRHPHRQQAPRGPFARSRLVPQHRLSSSTCFTTLSAFSGFVLSFVCHSRLTSHLLLMALVRDVLLAKPGSSGKDSCNHVHDRTRGKSKG